MKNFVRAFSLSTLALTLVSGTAYAADQQDCDKIMGFSGHARRELFPSTCGQTTAGNQVSGKTRNQVMADLAEAQKDGNIVTSFAAKSAREVHPGEYPEAAANLAQKGGGKTREQVEAELVVTKRSGSAMPAN
jgi:hypothetical protein